MYNITKKSYPLRAVLAVSTLCVATSVMADTVYTEDFTVSGTTNFGAVGWNAYLFSDAGNLSDLSTTGQTTIAGVFHTDYGYMNPGSSESYDDADGPGLMFTTETTAALDSTDITDILSLSVDTRLDGSSEDPAVARFAIQIGSQWYVSDISLSITTETGASGTITNFATSELFDFSSGDNWLEMTVTTGTGGGITVASSTVGGTLSGDVTAFGVYADFGNDGDHFRIDNYSVTVIPEPGTFALLGGVLAFSAVMIRRRK
jgi:hypothetical protein